jgi:tripartite-type tricarboxylate transporter receptor subunit TctC
MLLPTRRELLHGASGFTALALAIAGAKAATYPSRRIRLVVPFAAGGLNDVIARPWADKMSPSFGPVVVENIGGAGGAVGSAVVARAAADGYTLLLGNTGNQIITPLAAPHATYESAKEFRAIYRLAIRWKLQQQPTWRNQLGWLVIDGRSLELTIETTRPGPEPALEVSLRHQLA